ncbi:MAG: hypothetical protein H6719_08775 [Sandaracinaceae bacterium]|nr:hypothetical protein [Sandaracinaceae bacterium]
MRFDDRPIGTRPRSFWLKAACSTLSTLLFWAPALAYAQDTPAEVPSNTGTAVELELGDLDPQDLEQPTSRLPIDLPDSARPDRVPLEPAPDATPIALPGGEEGASAVTPQSISLPDAEGSVQGMGESFSPVLSSGTATFSVPIAVAPGRAGVQPSLALSYATTGGNGPVGFGWNLGAPMISRQTDRGLPRYVDAPLWHRQEDRFIYNGGQELVPVDSGRAATVDRHADPDADTAAVPSDVAGWQQYRARVEGGFMRFFRSPDSERWVVQSKDGTRFDFGPLTLGPPGAVSASANAVERDPDGGPTGDIFQWGLTRMTDPHGSSVFYVYDTDDGRSYLRDLYYVSPDTCAGVGPNCSASLDTYAARVHLVYEARSDVFAGYTTGWRIGTARRLKRVEVTAWDDTRNERTLVRRYHLRYQTDRFHSLLASVQVEGRPQTEAMPGVMVGDRHVSERSLGDRIVGELLPPMTFRYSEMGGGGPTSTPVAGFGGISTAVQSVASSPPHSVDEARSDLFDVNSDGLPDLIVTDPARYTMPDGSPAVGVFFNGFSGARATPAGAAATFSDAVPMPMDSSLSSVLNLNNLNVVPMDIDGDGRGDLLHMPRYRTYGWWAPTRRGADAISPADQGWEWTYAEIDLPADDTDPRIDLGRDGTHLRVVDVNNDHLIDVVRTTGTVMQTWLNLGWLPGGDGRFGSYTFTGTDYELSTQPVESCLLQEGLPVDFEDPEVRLADMNGDGLQDLVKIRRGRVVYWPGRGDGVFGTGDRTCPRGAGANRYIEMGSPPPELNPDLDGVYLTDVDMDGATDVVQVRFRDVDVWFNRAGQSFTERTIATGTPATPAFAPRIRFADIDGSATTDIVWANAHRWEYLDPTGGQRPRLLVGVDNGLGADTTIGYGSSAEDYVRDLAAASTSGESFTWTASPEGPDSRLCELSGRARYLQCDPSETNRADWLIRSSGSPVVSSVVRSVSTTDRFDALGRQAQVSESQFAYHDGYYEGIEQEFRGFGAADATTIGDWNNPTTHSRTHFLQGRRPSDRADDRLLDNPNEALKGREVLTEVFDDAGAYLSTSFAGVTNRHLMTGLDGREIHYAYVHETNELRYDTTPFAAGSGALTLSAVVTEAVAGDGSVTGGAVTRQRDVRIRGARTSRLRTTFDEVDNLGHIHQQTAHGHVDLMSGAGIDGLIVSHIEPELVNDEGWIWRTRQTSLTGHDLPGPVRETLNQYDPTTGDLVLARQVVTNPGIAYAFAGDTDGARAYSLVAEDLVASTAYDTWGNAIQSCAGADLAAGTNDCLRLGSVDLDGDYRQLVTAEHIVVSRSAPPLSSTGTWDRGLGAILTASDPNGLTSAVTYDGLGRLTSVTPPNVAGCSGSTPTTRIQYELTTDPARQPLSRVVSTTELDCSAIGADTLVSMAYVDGLGRARAALATDGVDHAWVRSGITTLDKKGSTRRTYQADFSDASDTDYRAVVALPADIPYAVTRYDGFGRARGVIAEDGAVVWTSYHSLSTDVCDPLDNDPASEHYRTCTTASTDGHGRTVDQVLRNRNPDTGETETYRLWTYYRADNAVTALVRTQTDPGVGRPASPGAPAMGRVVRTFTYDSVGRRLSSDDPDTDNPADANQATNSWRYLFNRVGDLVAVRDPRGCGQNFFYDLGGRLSGEQYVGCAEAQPTGSEGASLSVSGLVGLTYYGSPQALDVVYHYDAYPTGWLPASGRDAVPAAASPVLGRATGVTDRGQRSAIAYDDRGNVIWTTRQLAVISAELGVTSATYPDGRPAPGETGAVPTGTVEYDESNPYTRTATFDHASRPRSMELPRDPDFAGEAPAVGGLLTYNTRGLPASATAQIGADLHPIVTDIEYLRDGLVASVTYGDTDNGVTSMGSPAYRERIPTRSQTTYDIRRRPVRMTTTREAEPGADPETLGAVRLVTDQQLVWDAANNLTAVLDHRDGDDWPVGHLPQSVHIRHDSLYRVVNADYDYTQHLSGARTPQDGSSDWRDDFNAASAQDPMQTEPPDMVVSRPTDRVVSLAWSWDFLANQREWNDDQSSFYERSIGAITNGDQVTDATRPSALYLATNLDDGPGSNAGWVEVDYGRGGNMEAMTVHAQCVDSSGSCAPSGTDLASQRNALRTNCSCAVEQHYVYRWDELNRLAEARRYDRTAGTWQLEVRQRYRYDAANARVVKQTLDEEGCGGGAGLTPCERVALYPYPGDFERRGLARGFGEYVADAALGTETQYVIAGARTVFRAETPGGEEDLFQRDERLVVPLTDLIQTTSAAFDVRTGRLTEASTYYPNGGRETFLGDAEARVQPEVSGFTGKEADEEVGVVYFGERYLVPRIGRWASADPLHVHTVRGGEPLNSFHYLGGDILGERDELGLCPTGDCRGGGRETRHDRRAREQPVMHRVYSALESAGDAVNEYVGRPLMRVAVAHGQDLANGASLVFGADAGISVARRTAEILEDNPPISTAGAAAIVGVPLRVVSDRAAYAMEVREVASGRMPRTRFIRHIQRARTVASNGARIAAAEGASEAFEILIDLLVEEYGVNPDDYPPDNFDGDAPENVSQAERDARPGISRDSDMVGGDLAQGGDGVIYFVPGEGTPSGQGYVGSADDLPTRAATATDGRDRTLARPIGSYHIGDREGRRRAEQAGIDLMGGVNSLDNRRNEIAQDDD